MEVFNVQKYYETQEKVNYCEKQNHCSDTVQSMNTNDFQNEGNNLMRSQGENMDIVTQACHLVNLSPFKQSPSPRPSSSIIFSPGTNAFYQNMSTYLETLETDFINQHKFLPGQELQFSQSPESQNCLDLPTSIPAQTTASLKRSTPTHSVTNVLPGQSSPLKTTTTLSYAALPVSFDITEDTNNSLSLPSTIHLDKSSKAKDFLEELTSSRQRIIQSRSPAYEEELSKVSLELPSSTVNSNLVKESPSPSHFTTTVSQKCPFSPFTKMLHALNRVPSDMDTPVKGSGFLSDLIKSSTENQVSSTEPSTSPNSGNKTYTSHSEGEFGLSTAIINTQPCPICNKKISKSYLKMHIRLHSNQHENHCSYCSKKYTYKLVIKDSALKTFKKKVFQCEDCGKQYVKQKKFNVKRRQHALGYRFNKKTFGRSSISSGKIVESCSETMGEEEGKQIIKKKTANLCPICGKILAGQKCLKVHQCLHSGEMPFVCHHCDKKFRFRHSLNRHLEEHLKHIDYSYGCKISEKRYDKQTSISVHKPGPNINGESVSEDNAPHSLGDTNTVAVKASQKVSETDINKMTNVLRNKNLFKKVGKKFKCLVCDKMFLKKHLLNKHLKVHEEAFDDNDKVFTCSFCFRELANLTLLRDHIMKHALKIFVESISSETATRSPQWLGVNRNEEYSVRDTSDIDFLGSLEKVENKQGQFGSYVDDMNESDALLSDACVVSFTAKKRSRKRKLSKPLKIGHNYSDDENLDMNDNFPIDTVNSDTGNDALEVNGNQTDQAKETTVVSTVRKRKGKKRKGNNLICHICGEKATCSRTLKSHMKSHKQTSFVCEKCGREYKYEKYLKRHLLSHENQDGKKKQAVQSKIKCKQCNKVVQTDSMKIHMRVHTGERPFQCHHCGATFKQITHLKTHFRTHTGEKPYQCPDCGKVFRKSGNMIIHMRNHTGERPYECEKCRATFKHLALFKEHMASHDGITLYQCDQCGHRYKSRSGYDSHKRRHHQKCPEYKCYLCGVVYQTSSEVKNCSCSSSKNASSVSLEPDQSFQGQKTPEIESVEHLPETSVKSLTYVSESNQYAVSVLLPSVYSCMMDVVNNPVDVQPNNESSIKETNSYQH